ncbi:hypothetical protein BJV77DRAFT_335066 [Russula vinacea]|nr:hypothetical protein BJV77DRAFT_335066 [Russula vinacea]
MHDRWKIAGSIAPCQTSTFRSSLSEEMMNNHEKVRPHHDRSPLSHSPYFFYRRCGVGNFCSGYYGLHFYCDFCVRITTRSCATPQGRRHCQGPFHDRGIHKLLASKGSEQKSINVHHQLMPSAAILHTASSHSLRRTWRSQLAFLSHRFMLENQASGQIQRSGAVVDLCWDVQSFFSAMSQVSKNFRHIGQLTISTLRVRPHIIIKADLGPRPLELRFFCSLALN